jgi:hypothetical protein
MKCEYRIHGVGIPERSKRKLFSPMFRAKKEDGMGGYTVLQLIFGMLQEKSKF